MAYWPYLGLKWYLVAAGAIIAVGLAYQEWSEGRMALGAGIAVAVVGGTLKGIMGAIKRRRDG